MPSKRKPRGGQGAKSKWRRSGVKSSKQKKVFSPPHGSGRDFGKADRVPRKTKRF